MFKKLEGKDKLIVLVGLFTGMRLNEVLKLTWADIDFQKQLITFVQSKTGKLISMPLSTHMVQELMAYKSICSSEFLFESRGVNAAVVSSYSAYFSNLFKGLGISDFTYHNLRHTFASMQGDLGTRAIVTKELLGHSDLSMTMQYIHTGLESKRRAVDALTNHVLKGCKEDVFPLTIQA